MELASDYLWASPVWRFARECMGLWRHWVGLREDTWASCPGGWESCEGVLTSLGPLGVCLLVTLWASHLTLSRLSSSSGGLVLDAFIHFWSAAVVKSSSGPGTVPGTGCTAAGQKAWLCFVGFRFRKGRHAISV